MNETISKLLNGRGNNHMLPFFWQHGEDEPTLRHYMEVIENAGCGAVCVESRPHPDFCGPKWWQDMDVILDEARKRDMKVWILDDSHFPTGFANGAVQDAPNALCRQSICATSEKLPAEAKILCVALEGKIPPPFVPNRVEGYMLAQMPEPRHYDDDTVIKVSAFNNKTKESIDLTAFVQDGFLKWSKPKGEFTLWITGLSRNCGPHRNYINMMSMPSVRLLIDAVYEKHWEHYKTHFGKTIAGFFSDEPELGNGHMYVNQNQLGTDQDLPFSDELAQSLEQRLGANWAGEMYLLWENKADDDEKARVRYAYMDSVTKLIRKDFSFQLGDWCREHGVEYIGHIIEDNGSHARTGSSLGHYFRGLQGQDMSGIDDIGGQVYPQGEDDNKLDWIGNERQGDFYHFLLGRLASSAAAIEPMKKGRAMCEVFGNYGWGIGIKTMKYLADHFLVRGINYYVPHAFSPAPFPDKDCPPHFYAHGHNPQYRYFGGLMRYMNRVCNLISAGDRVVEAALLYHAEAEWTGNLMNCEKPARILEENQISFDVIPNDVFGEAERYKTELGSTLQVNTQRYKILLVPMAQYITAEFAESASKLITAGFPVVFIGAKPEGMCNGDDTLLSVFQGCPVVQLEELAGYLTNMGIGEIKAAPFNQYMRALHIDDGEGVYLFVNEATEPYIGTITVPNSGPCFAYNAWDNRLETVEAQGESNTTKLTVTIAPMKSLIIVFGDYTDVELYIPPVPVGNEIQFEAWQRATCDGVTYPNFGEYVPIQLPDHLAEEQPEFSGFVRYTSEFNTDKLGKLILEISDASEGVEVFVNNQSMGLQYAPPYRYDISSMVKQGRNEIAIEVATTLERQVYHSFDQFQRTINPAPSSDIGLNGIVKLYQNN